LLVEVEVEATDFKSSREQVVVVVAL